MSSETPVIPIFLDMEPTELQDVELGPFASSFSDWIGYFGDSEMCMGLIHATGEDAVRQVSSITGHGLARYDG